MACPTPDVVTIHHGYPQYSETASGYSVTYQYDVRVLNIGDAVALCPRYGAPIADQGWHGLDAHAREITAQNIQNDPDNPLCRVTVVFTCDREDDYWTLDMSPEQVHITNVKKYEYQRRYWQDQPNGAEDVSTAIGRSQDGKEVEGVDIYSPYMAATVTKFFDEDEVDDRFLRALEEGTAHTNDREFWIGGKLKCEPGECLFLAPVIDGLNLNKKVRVQYRFLIRRNQKDMEIELDSVFGIDHPQAGARAKVKVDKEGWEYLWNMKGRYILESAVAANNQVCVGLVSVHVAKVYESYNFDKLNSDIGLQNPIVLF